MFPNQPSNPESPRTIAPMSHSFSLSSTWKTLVDLVNAPDSDSSELELESLEARVLYDASPLLAVAGESLEPNVELHLDEIAELCFDESLEHPAYEIGDIEDCLIVDAQALNQSPAQLDIVTRQLVVIDERIEGFEALVADITENGDGSIDVLMVNQGQNGIELVSKYLNGLSKYGAIHIVGHGSEDQIQLGSENLSSESLMQYEDELRTWNRGLESDADILLYGCEVAGSAEGQQLVDQISSITGADVAASDDLTGNKDLGGDWEFEYVVGAVQADVLFSVDVQQNWYGTLAATTVTTTADVISGDADLTNVDALNANPGSDGVISLREAIIAADNIR